MFTSQKHQSQHWPLSKAVTFTCQPKTQKIIGKHYFNCAQIFFKWGDSAQNVALL